MPSPIKLTHLARKLGPDGEPLLGPPHPKQMQVLWELLKPPHFQKGVGDDDRVVRRVNLCCGWGFGKTQVAIDAAQAFLDWCPGMNVLFTEPDVGLMNTFLEMWESTIPGELYKRYGDPRRVIVWKRTGNKMWYDHRNFRGSLTQTIKHFQGKTIALHIDDETSTDCSLELMNSISVRIRQPGVPVLARLTTTTPRMGDYVELLAQPDSVTITGTSYDNPYLPKSLIAQQRASMSRAQARRDIDGELVALEDQLWPDVDLVNSWPIGNVDDMHPRFNPAYPWYLGSDMGSATGAYVVVQPVTNGMGNGQPRWVIVSDLCPQSSGNVRDAFTKLRERFGVPAGVVSGIGMNTRADTDGATPAFFVGKVWNNQVDIMVANEDHISKHIQYENLSALFCAADGTRRLTIARDMLRDQHDPLKAQLDRDSHRGVVEMIQQDVWPADANVSSRMYLPKGPKIRVSHIRDALLELGVMVMSPPEWIQLRCDRKRS